MVHTVILRGARIVIHPETTIGRRGLLGTAAAALLPGGAWGRRRQPEAAQPAGDLGTLRPFYRSMQMQGHLIGQDLIAIPAYLRAADIDLRYRVNPRLRQEIPFVDSFSIARFLGGISNRWLQQSGQLDPALGDASLDYVVEQNGALHNRPELIRKHLDPYLNAGYALSDITIVTDNVPWGIARDHGSSGSYGQRNPPISMELWRTTIGDLAADLHRLYGGVAPGFKIGVEFDTRKSFNGSAQDYQDLYTNAYQVLKAAFPQAQIAASEFTGSGECAANAKCIYDEGDFLRQAKAAGVSPDYVPRSLNTFLSQGNSMPSHTVRRCEESFARFGSVVAEIDQFGLLGQPFGKFATYGSDLGGRRAAWEFAVLMGLAGALRPRRVYHWATIVDSKDGGAALLNGVGFVRLLLDRLEGARMTRLATRHANDAGGDAGGSDDDRRDGAEAMAVAFDGAANGPRRAIVVSSYSTRTGGSARVSVDVPDAIDRNWRFTRWSEAGNVFAAIRDDLQKDGNLKPEFAAAPGCTSDPHRMAQDPSRANAMVNANAARYQAVIRADLRLKPMTALPYRLTQSDGRLQIDMPSNELLLLES